MSEIYWQQLKTKVNNQIDFYWNELKAIDSKDDPADPKKMDDGIVANKPSAMIEDPEQQPLKKEADLIK